MRWTFSGTRTEGSKQTSPQTEMGQSEPLYCPPSDLSRLHLSPKLESVPFLVPQTVRVDHQPKLFPAEPRFETSRRAESPSGGREASAATSVLPQRSFREPPPAPMNLRVIPGVRPSGWRAQAPTDGSALRPTESYRAPNEAAFSDEIAALGRADWLPRLPIRIAAVQMPHQTASSDQWHRGGVSSYGGVNWAFLVHQSKEWSEIGLAVYRVGVGMYHSSLVVDNTEWHFWEGYGIEARRRFFNEEVWISIDHLPFVTLVPIDTLMVPPRHISEICAELADTQFSKHTYDIIKCNCNHFTAEVLRRLGLEAKMPTWINRLASTADSVCSTLPFVRTWIDTFLNRSSVINRGVPESHEPPKKRRLPRKASNVDSALSTAAPSTASLDEAWNQGSPVRWLPPTPAYC